MYYFERYQEFSKDEKSAKRRGPETGKQASKRTGRHTDRLVSLNLLQLINDVLNVFPCYRLCQLAWMAMRLLFLLPSFSTRRIRARAGTIRYLGNRWNTSIYRYHVFTVIGVNNQCSNVILNLNFHSGTRAWKQTKSCFQYAEQPKFGFKKTLQMVSLFEDWNRRGD